MSPWMKNQSAMRPNIFSGSPKKKAAWLSALNRKCGTRPGTVSTCHAPKIAASTTSCHARRLARAGLKSRNMEALTFGSCRELLPVAGEHFLAQHVPDRLVQLDEAR